MFCQFLTTFDRTPVPHTAVDDGVYDGFHIPKGTYLIVSLSGQARVSAYDSRCFPRSKLVVSVAYILSKRPMAVTFLCRWRTTKPDTPTHTRSYPDDSSTKMVRSSPTTPNISHLDLVDGFVWVDTLQTRRCGWRSPMCWPYSRY